MLETKAYDDGRHVRVEPEESSRLDRILCIDLWRSCTLCTAIQGNQKEGRC